MSFPSKLSKEIQRADASRKAQILNFSRVVNEAIEAEKIADTINGLMNAERTVGVRVIGGPESKTEYIKEPDWVSRGKGVSAALQWKEFDAAYVIGKPVQRVETEDVTKSDEERTASHETKLRGSAVYRDAVLETVLKVAFETPEGRDKVFAILDSLAQ